MNTDPRGLPLSGADTAQAAAYNDIQRQYIEYRATTYPALKALCAEAADFPMAHMMKGYMLITMGSHKALAAARACAAHVADRAELLTAGERHHHRALAAWAQGDTAAACRHWDEALFHQPLDLLALRLQHFALFWMGAAERMRDAVARVRPAWTTHTPGYASVLGMAAFALEETGDYAAAEACGREAVERHADDLWGVHAVAHLYDMQGRLAEGIAWLDSPLDRWEDRNPFRSHLWWHAAMFAYEKGEYDRALDLYDSAVRPAESDFYLDIQNSASLLVRLEFAGVEVGERWGALAESVEGRQGEQVPLFTEPHCAMVLGRSGRGAAAAAHIASLRRAARAPHYSAGALVEPLVAPLCGALGDFYRGEYGAAAETMFTLRYDYPPMGGSHTQRDIFGWYLIEATARGGELQRARSLLEERLARRPNSHPSWRRYAELCEGLDDPTGAARARGRCEGIAAAG